MNGEGEEMVSTEALMEELVAAVEKAARKLDVVEKKRMTLESFLDQAAKALAQAAHEEPEVAQKRLEGLKSSLESVRESFSKLNAEDLESGKVKVTVETAWAPLSANGDKPEDLTSAEDQSSSELPFTGPSTRKALEKLEQEIDGLRTRATKSDTSADETPASLPLGDGEGWPLDMNTAQFREGVKKAAAAAPTWGDDPRGLVRQGNGTP